MRENYFLGRDRANRIPIVTHFCRESDRRRPYQVWIQSG